MSDFFFVNPLKPIKKHNSVAKLLTLLKKIK